MNREMNVNGSIEAEVLRRGRVAAEAGLDGLVSSAAELNYIKGHLPSSFYYVTPGVRPAGSTSHDHLRMVSVRGCNSCRVESLGRGKGCTWFAQSTRGPTQLTKRDCGRARLVVDFAKKPVIACVHLLPTPGSPQYDGNIDQIYERALAEAKIFSDCGVDALIVENFRDGPFFPGHVPVETSATLAGDSGNCSADGHSRWCCCLAQ